MERLQSRMQVRGGLLGQLSLLQEMSQGSVVVPQSVFQSAARGAMRDMRELEGDFEGERAGPVAVSSGAHHVQQNTPDMPDLHLEFDDARGEAPNDFAY